MGQNGGDGVYWRRNQERRVGIAGDIEVIGIPPIGTYPPAVLLRHPSTMSALYFTMKSAVELNFQLAIWIQEQQGKLKLL